MDTARVNTFATMVEVPFMSKRFAMKRFLGMTSEEIAENQEMWREENGLAKNAIPANSELRSAGITADGMQNDVEELGSAAEAPEGMEPGEDLAGGDGMPQSSEAAPAPTV